jgi:hypothetical protein
MTTDEGENVRCRDQRQIKRGCRGLIVGLTEKGGEGMILYYILAITSVMIHRDRNRM